MAEEIKNTEDSSEKFEVFVSEISKFSKSYTESFVSYFEEDNRPETDYVRLQMEAVNNVFANISRELKRGYEDAEPETRSLVERHIGNSSSISLLRSSTSLFAKRSTLGFLDKIAPILELIKKLIQQIVDLFPKFLGGILDRIINPLLEILDNILPMILDLIGGGGGTKLMVDAEHRFLDAHPKWRQLYYSNRRNADGFD